MTAEDEGAKGRELNFEREYIRISKSQSHKNQAREELQIMEVKSKKERTHCRCMWVSIKRS